MSKSHMTPDKAVVSVLLATACQGTPVERGSVVQNMVNSDQDQNCDAHPHTSVKTPGWLIDLTPFNAINHVPICAVSEYVG